MSSAVERISPFFTTLPVLLLRKSSFCFEYASGGVCDDSLSLMPTRRGKTEKRRATLLQIVNESHDPHF